MKKFSIYTLVLIAAVTVYYLYPGQEQSKTIVSDAPGHLVPSQSLQLQRNQPHISSEQQTVDRTRAGRSVAVIAPPESQVLYTELAYLESVQEDNIGYADTVQLVYSMLSHEQPLVRLEATASIAEYRQDEMNFELVNALNDPDPKIRTAVVEALGMQTDEYAVFYLEPALHDQDKQVRLAAIRAIAEQENEQSVHALSGLLSDGDEDIRLNVVAALGEIGGETSVYYLQQQRYDSDRRVRRTVEAILDELYEGF